MPEPLTLAPAARVTVLADGPDNLFAGCWPDRICTQALRPELHGLAASGTPRARALVLAGGGYLQLMHDKEGVEVAQWLATLGIEAQVLLHRLPGQPDGRGGVWPQDIALHDGLLALQHLGGQAELPLFIVGLSSGGHLAGVLACQAQARTAGALGALIAYAPLNANHRAYKVPAGKPDYPPSEKQAFYDAWPIGLAAEPHGLPPLPLFLAYALHDAAVPVAHALRTVEGVQQAGGSVELHVFPDAPHGFALREHTGTHAHWPALAERWINETLRSAAACTRPTGEPL